MEPDFPYPEETDPPTYIDDIEYKIIFRPNIAWNFVQAATHFYYNGIGVTEIPPGWKYKAVVGTRGGVAHVETPWWPVPEHGKVAIGNSTNVRTWSRVIKFTYDDDTVGDLYFIQSE